MNAIEFVRLEKHSHRVFPTRGRRDGSRFRLRADDELSFEPCRCGSTFWFGVSEFAAARAAQARCGKVEAMVNIYVGNLAWAYTSDDLLKLFSPHGQVARAQIVMDRETGRSRGFGFVEMPNQAEAEAAIQALNGADINGRPLTVNEAKPREPRSGGGGGGRGYGGGGGGGYRDRGPRY